MGIEKSPNDSREYKYFLLDNQIKCLVISDRDTDLSAACLNVNVGNFSDPIETPGLAHFLEHMLFMGTEKFPEENHYLSFISNHSGSRNGTTSSENTYYYFKIANDSLYEILDIFSQFFIAPLLSEDAVSREMKAVDSEHKRNLKDDNRRLYRLLRMGSNPDHPFSHFGTGSIETLTKPDIHSQVKRFYEEKYSSNLMTCVVYGKETVDILESWVREKFSPVLNKNYRPVVDYGLPFGEDSLGIMYKVIPVKDIKEVRLTWQLPGMNQYWKQKPSKYLSHLLGHEGKNSLLSSLKAENLASSTSCSHDYADSAEFSVLRLLVGLTDKGFENYNRVLELIHLYIQMLKETGAQEWVFEELKSMDIANFYNKNKSDPMNYVVEMAENLHDYIPEKVITGPCLRIEFDKSTIDSLFSYLTPQNLQIYLISSTFDKSTFLTEEIYGTLYHREKIPAPLINLLENPGKTPESLNLPLKNDFIPTEFHVLSSESDQIPQLLAENSKYTLWHMQDTEFNVDKIYAKVMLHCNDYGVNDIAFFNLLSRIWVDVFNHKFAETDYLANLAGLKLNLTVENYGLDVGLFGYSQKFDVFLIEFFGQLASFGISFEDREIFEIYLKKMKDGINNYFVSSPLNQATNIVNDIVNVNCHFSYEDKQKAVEKINFEHLLFFSGQFLTNIRHEWFIIGNIDKYRASLIVDSAVLTLEINRKINYVTKDEYPSLRVLEIPAIMTDISKSTSNYLVNHLDLTNPNSAVISIFQIGPETLKSQSAVLILANYLREPSFDTLRTKEQLGYSVSVMSRKIRSCMFFSINVQSAVKSCAYVTSRISAFIDSMKTKIQAMTDDEYSEVKNSALKRHSKKEISLTEKYDKFNLEIIRGSYWFNRKEDIEIELKNMSKQEFVEFFMDTFYNRQARIDIEVISENLKSENSTLNSENHREVIRSVDEYKRKQNVFRQSYIKS